MSRDDGFWYDTEYGPSWDPYGNEPCISGSHSSTPYKPFISEKIVNYLRVTGYAALFIYALLSCDGCPLSRREGVTKDAPQSQTLSVSHMDPNIADAVTPKEAIFENKQ